MTFLHRDRIELQRDQRFILSYLAKCRSKIAEVLTTRAGTNTPSDEYDTYRDTGWRIRYVSRIHFFSEAKLGNG